MNPVIEFLKHVQAAIDALGQAERVAIDNQGDGLTIFDANRVMVLRHKLAAVHDGLLTGRNN